MIRKLLLIAFLFVAFQSSAQISDIPTAVIDAFKEQYPLAKNIKYQDDFIGVIVNFNLNGENMIASYTNRGKWKHTERDWNWNKVPAEIKDGFSKSKYADWKITETKVVYKIGGIERFRVRVEKGVLQRKYLFFNEEGRLVEDAFTI